MNIADIEDAEHFADETDRAANITAMANQEALDNQLRSVEKAPEGFDGETCWECNQDLSKERLGTGAFRCVPCQEQVEFRRKLYRRT